MILLIISLISALLFAIIGIGLYRHPDLIAGYQNLTDKEKQSAFYKDRTRYIRDLFVAASITMAVGGIIAYVTKREIFGVLFIVLPPVLTTILLLSKGGNKKRRNKYLILFISLLGLAPIGFAWSTFYFGDKEPVVTIENDTLYIKGGLYDNQIPVNDITKIALIDRLPQINRRENGYAKDDVRQGLFSLDSLGQAHLYLERAHYSPYIWIEDKAGMHYIINFKDSVDTKKTYEQIISHP